MLGGLRARSTELLHFISSHPVDLVCIQKSKLNLFSSFWIPGFSALRSDGTHSRSDIFSTDVTDASGDVIIFVRQGLSFFELSTFSLSSLDPYSDCVEVNISLNDSSSLLFLMFMLPLFSLLPRIAKLISFLPPMWKRWNFRAFASTEKGPLPHPWLEYYSKTFLMRIVYTNPQPISHFSVPKFSLESPVGQYEHFFFFIYHIYPPFTRKRCIAMFWTVSPHSLGSCHFRVTCLPHKSEASR